MTAKRDVLCDLCGASSNLRGSEGPLGWVRSLSLHVFPVPRLSFREPLNGRRHAPFSRRFLLGLVDPLDVFALVTRRKRIERRLGFSTPGERGVASGRHFRNRRLLSRRARERDAL